MIVRFVLMRQPRFLFHDSKVTSLFTYSTSDVTNVRVFLVVTGFRNNTNITVTYAKTCWNVKLLHYVILSMTCQESNIFPSLSCLLSKREVKRFVSLLCASSYMSLWCYCVSVMNLSFATVTNTQEMNTTHQFTTNNFIAFRLRCSITLLSLSVVFYANYLYSAHFEGQDIDTVKENSVKFGL